MTEAAAICETLRREGFNDVRFSRAKVEDDLKYEEVADELTPEEWDIRQRDMAYFIAEPEFPMLDVPQSRYVDEPMFDQHAFYRELIAWVQKRVGDDVTVNYREGCSEFELLRQPPKTPTEAKHNPIGEAYNAFDEWERRINLKCDEAQTPDGFVEWWEAADIHARTSFYAAGFDVK